MTIHDFVRFFVRFNGLCFVFWALYTLIDIPPFYRNYVTVFEVPSARAIAAQDFWSFVLKVAVQLLIGAVLLGRTEHFINLLSNGSWAIPPNKALEPTPTSVTSPAAEEPRQP